METPSQPPTTGVERLLAAIDQRGDFPAMAKTIGLISALTSSEGTSSGALADTILQDLGLSQKILQMVNSAKFAQYDQVTTISRAVLLMGFERVRSIASGLVLFEHLRKQAKAPGLADELNMAYYSAILGRNIAQQVGDVDPEEAFISALFHKLGRILVAFYLPGDYARIQAAGPGQEDRAAFEVLGRSYDATGTAVADSLGLPDRLKESLVPVSPEATERAMSPAQRLGCVATLANTITQVLATNPDPTQREADLSRFLGSYGGAFDIEPHVVTLMVKAAKEVRDTSPPAFRTDVPGSRFVAELTALAARPIGSEDGGAAGPAEGSSPGVVVSEPGAAGVADGVRTPENVLTQGLREVTALLVGDYAVDDVLRVILETIYQALGIGQTRVFFLLKHPTQSVATFRFGFGQSTMDMKGWHEVPLSGTKDLFSMSFTKQQDVVIRDATSIDVLAQLPSWYTRMGVANRFLVLLPLVVEQQSVGFFYLDGENELLPKLTPAVLNALKALRGQAMLAIRRKAWRAPGQRA